MAEIPSGPVRAWCFEPTMASAREATAAGELVEWSLVFNRSPHGNRGIARGLAEEDFIYMLAEINLRDVNCPSGPDPAFDFPEDPEDWKARCHCDG